MADSFQYRMTDSRERRLNHLLEATGQNAKSKALDDAISLYLYLVGGNPADPQGRINAVLQLAETDGPLSGEEIAETLDSRALSVSYETQITYSVDP
jgi:hypothetical protein